MIWTIIRDFFVRYIFGGTDSNLAYFNCGIGEIFSWNGANSYNDASTYDTFIKIGNEGFYNPNGDELFDFISIGDYLSTTATIITLVVLSVVVALGIRWLFRFMISRFTKWGL